MSLLDVLGELTGFDTGRKAWSLKNDDTGEVIRGQFVPTEYTENIGAKIPDSSTVNQQNPFPQWIGGEAEIVSFKARVYATNSFKSVKDDIDKLKASSRKVDTLKRAPIFTFTWGTEIAFKCFVLSPGGIRYDEIRSDGSIRGAEFQMTLKRIEEIPTQAAATSLAAKIKAVLGVIGVATQLPTIGNLVNIPGGSLHRKSRTIRAKTGDTFESIAALEYGDALVGDILRRVQPDKATLKPGDEVILVDNTEIFQIDVTPQSVALRDSPEVMALKEAKFAARRRAVPKLI